VWLGVFVGFGALFYVVCGVFYVVVILCGVIDVVCLVEVGVELLG